MNEDQFWQIISDSAMRDSEGYPKVDLLREKLSALSNHELVSWQEHFDRAMRRSYTGALWGAAYIICHGAGQDGFDEFRAALILLGREVFQHGIEDPDSLADFVDEDIGCETVLFLAQQIYERRTNGRQMPNMKPRPLLYGLEGGPDWESDEAMISSYPRLVAKFGL